MARNRKRRSAGRPTDAPPAQPGVATARPQRARTPRDEPAHDEPPREERVDAPDPLAHAAPDAEIVEAQLAAGEAAADEPEELTETDDDELLDDGGIGDEGPGGPRRRRGGGGGDDSGGELTSGGDRVPVPASPRRRRNGLIAFAQGSWRELQRVQWPDQRQTVQATWVVIGFVIVAGAWLGVADWVATKIVHFILS